MHTLNRILTALVLLVVLVPPATFALVSFGNKEETRQELEQAIGSAVQKYQQRSGLQSTKGKGEKLAAEQQQKISSLSVRKQELRNALAKEQRILRDIGNRYGLTLSSKDQVATLLNTEKRRMARLLRAEYLRSFAIADQRTHSALIESMLRTDAMTLSSNTIAKVQERFLRDMLAAEKVFARLDSVAAERESVLKEYWAAEHKYDEAMTLVERSEAQLAEIKRITEEVHGQVLRLQGELARIDARIKAKAERELIEKGIITAKDIGTDTAVYKPQFSWPVYGKISAGFKNTAYHTHFGVPHYGVDIVVGQGTPVTAAADGVVFLYRDGGAKGYSYVLIGHRGGYATLYGHVSSALVGAGQDVKAGQAIALSGGQPGTHGAGPMTTGPHLHFEVIKAGTNVDPKSVLP